MGRLCRPGLLAMPSAGGHPAQSGSEQRSTYIVATTRAPAWAQKRPGLGADVDAFSVPAEKLSISTGSPSAGSDRGRSLVSNSAASPGPIVIVVLGQDQTQLSGARY